MKALRSILVAVDFSPNSEHALDWAIALARTGDVIVHVLHAMHVPPDLRMAGEWFATLRGHAVAGLDRCGDRLDAAGVKYETHLENEHPVEAIVQLALRVEADLVVIGSRGHGGVAQLLLGSVAQATLRAAPCPVLTVPPAN